MRGAAPILILVSLVVSSSCGGDPEPPLDPEVKQVLPWLGSSDEELPPVSARGGTPATGPGNRYNHCERIWCITHGENFYIDHFMTKHSGWILHDDSHGDVFVPRKRRTSPGFPDAWINALNLCGRHVHPYALGKNRGSRGAPVLGSGFNQALGYSRSHYRAWGTRLDECCINGLGWGYIHALATKQFRFHSLDQYREFPDAGWQKPFRSGQAGIGSR